MNRSQARAQVVTVWGCLTPMSDSEKSVRACQAASWCGAVQVGLESGRDLPAVPIRRRTASRGTELGGTCAGGDRGLGPGLPAFASGRPAGPVAFPRALRSGAGGAPFYDQHVAHASVVPARAHTSRP